MSNMNPFEIRLEILKMAKEMMDRQYDETSSMWWNLAERVSEAANEGTSSVIAKSQELMAMKPEMYTPAAMMEKAQELYSFVSKKD